MLRENIKANKEGESELIALVITGFISIGIIYIGTMVLYRKTYLSCGEYIYIQN